MELQHVNVKIFVAGELPVDPVKFIDVFHRWIQEDKMPELLVDVADYRHVPKGPGVLLICHECDYSMDHTHGRWGMRYNRKAALEGSNADRFKQAVAGAARGCLQMEKEFAANGALNFSRSELTLFVNDRAFAPNTPETLAAAKPDIESFFRAALGHSDFTLAHDRDPRARFGVTLKSKKDFDLAKLV